MPIRLIGLPWWARWVCTSLLMALVMCPLLLISQWDLSVAWIGSVIGFCVVVAAISVAFQEQTHRAYSAVLDGAGDAKRAAVVAALWRRRIPADPAVLRYAIELGEILSKVRKDLSSLSWPAMWVGIVLLQVLPGHNLSSAIGWALWASLLVPFLLSQWYVARRQERHIALLGAAANGQSADSGPFLGKRDRLWLAVIAAGLVACVVGLAVTFERQWPRRDCEQTHDVIVAVNERNWLTNGRLVVQGGPSVADYQGWSDQLQREAAKMTTPDVAPHVRRIAELSVQVTDLVRSAYAAAPTSSAAEAADREVAYQKLVGQMLGEVKAVKTFCWGE
ncbi:hypothetical protein [Mycobacteroides abscessus]|uniref:hypothetical protein n=1 Tax=Mycobacteroides abscessus TaxID=36809 RepID=UPI001600BAF8|nr:hypothetical protein [Mycobacteroides abscessus]